MTKLCDLRSHATYATRVVSVCYIATVSSIRIATRAEHSQTSGTKVLLRSIRHGRPQAAESETKVQCGVGKWLRLSDRAKFEDESLKGQVSVECRVWLLVVLGFRRPDAKAISLS